MEPGAMDPAQRIVVCLVADEAAADRMPASLRYLQVGLFDEQIDAFLIAPQGDRAATFISGPTTLMTYPESHWPLARWSNRQWAAETAARIEAHRRKAPVLVHCFGSICAKLAQDLAARLDAHLVRTLWSAEDIHHDGSLSAVDSFIVPSEVIALELKNRRDFRHAAEVIPLGVPAPQSLAAFKDNQRGPVLIMAGLLREHAGIETIIRTAGRVAENYPNLLLFIMGKGPGEAALRHLVDSLGLSNRIIFTGRVDYLRTALEAADIYCHTAGDGSYREELPQSMMAGLAVVAVHQSPYDGLEHDRTAMLFNQDDEDELAACLLHLLEHTDDARRIAAAGQTYARTHNAIGRMVSKHVDVYRRLCSADHTFAIPHANS